MEPLNVCPSTLAEGFNNYSPAARKLLFDGRDVSHILGFDSPNNAYDLINTSLHLYEPRIFALDKGLFREGMQFSDTHTVSRQDFEEFGRRIGLSSRLVKRELDSFATEHPRAYELISHSFLSEQLKRYYRQSYNYRRTTLVADKP